MKKLISIIISMLMVAFAVGASATAFAAEPPIHSIESSTQQIKVEITVNGNSSIHGNFESVDPESNDNKVVIKFTYDDNGVVQRWEVPGLVENVDYKVLSSTGKELIIQVIKPEITYVLVNAVTENGEVEIEGESDDVESIDNNKTSPKTGASISAGIALMAAGASLIAIKRKTR